MWRFGDFIFHLFAIIGGGGAAVITITVSLRVLSGCGQQNICSYLSKEPAPCYPLRITWSWLLVCVGIGWRRVYVAQARAPCYTYTHMAPSYVYTHKEPAPCYAQWVARSRLLATHRARASPKDFGLFLSRKSNMKYLFLFGSGPNQRSFAF